MNGDQFKEGTRVSDGVDTDTAFGVVQKLAGNMGNAAINVAGATKTASRQLSSIAFGEMKKLKEGLDNLIVRLPAPSSDDLHIEKVKLLEQIAITKDVVNHEIGDARVRASQSIDATSNLIKGRPFQSIAMAVGTGILIGILISRRK
ncbi:ElaB/YqjD/DUF883 family membrane-anchored ribosome-binding protein [Undibacterium sp. GrIS 1.8]|uniref:DUF883 family protein n=1 Tax=Undibacterium sp. GrIS 1.8 TaxID=3143934 RepID=UPI0033945DE8